LFELSADCEENLRDLPFLRLLLFRRCPQDAIHILLDNAIPLHLTFGIIVLPLQLVFLLNQLPLCRKQRGLQKIRP